MSERMKTHHYIVAAFLLVAVLVVVIGVYVNEEPESPALTTVSGESGRLDRLFQEMGIAQVASTDPLSEVAFRDLDGRTVNLSDFKGKIVFLNFWTTWCAACRDEMPQMEKLYAKFKNADFAMLAVDLQESAAVVRDFFKYYKLSFTALLDPDAMARSLFAVRSIPTTLILDKEGRIVGAAVGSREWDSKESLALFELLISAAQAPPAA